MPSSVIRIVRVSAQIGFLAAFVMSALIALAQTLSPATKRLFDAVWADDLANVKASIDAGADLSAINELGVRPVDMAVDKGHYDIAHYLLSVEKVRSASAATQTTAPTPRERVAARAVEPAPAPTPTGSGWLRGSSGGLAASQPAPPAPAPVAPVQAAATAPRVAAPPPKAPSTHQENLWSPGNAASATEAPTLRVVSVAEPQTIPDSAPATAAGAPGATAVETPAPKEPKRSLGDPAPSTGWLDRVTGLFDTADDPSVATAPPVETEPKTAPPAATADSTAVSKIASPPKPEAVTPSANTATSSAPTETSSAPATSTSTESAASGEDLFSRLGDLFKAEPADTTVPAAADTPPPAEVNPARIEEQIDAPTPVAPAAASAKPVVETPAAASADTADAVPASDEPGVFARLAEVFKPAEPDRSAEADDAANEASDEPSANNVATAGDDTGSRPSAATLSPPTAREPTGAKTAEAETTQPPLSAASPQTADRPALSGSQTASSDEPGLFARLSDIFRADEPPAAGTSSPEVPSATPALESAETPQVEPQAAPDTGAAVSRASETPPAPEAAAAPSDAAAETTDLFDKVSNWFSGSSDPATSSTETQVAEAEPATLPPGTVRKVSPPPAETAPPPPEPKTAALSRASQPQTPAPAQASEARPSIPMPSAPVGTPARPAKEPAQVASVPTGPNATGMRQVLSPESVTAKGSTADPAAPLDALPPLSGVTFRLTPTSGLDRRLSDAQRAQCIDKSRWNTAYCIEPMAWPDDMASAFDVSTTFYRGKRAIVEYIAGRSTQYHVMFPAKELRRVSEHFVAKYGPPTEMPEVWTALIGLPKRPNRTLRWRSRDPTTGAETVLEVREIDDLRWSSPPDVRHGVVRVYKKGRGSVFELLSSTDLLLVQLRRR